MYSITFKELSDDEVEKYVALAIQSDGFYYAFFKDPNYPGKSDVTFLQLFFKSEHYAILFELKHR